MHPKSPRFFGLGGRPRLDVVDGGKVVNESDRMSESLAETQAGGPAPSQVDPREAASLAETLAPARRPAARTGDDRIRSAESLDQTRAASGEIAGAPAGDDAAVSGLQRTMLATGEAGEAGPSLRSRSGDRVEVGLARTMDSSDPAARRSASAAMDADLIGLARTQTPDAVLDLAAPSRPSLRRDEAITDEPDLERRVLQADAEDRRLKEMIRARLFRKKAAPVKIGRFTILDRLGEGGMGVVYTAYDDQLDRKVAIKVMRSEGGEDSLGGARLRREAQAMARLSHPNIVTVHEVNDYEGQLYVAMEYIRGQSLDRWLQEPHPWQEVLAVFLQAGRGLEAAHRAGLVHRDFKPHNVLLGDDGTAKVLDFGLVRATSAAEVDAAAGAMVPAETQALSLLDASLTRTGAIMGTPAYMAPEQHMGLVATARSDLFSFCVALYEGLYADHPYECSSLAALIAAVTGGTIKDAPAGTRVPAWLRKVVLRGLAVDPERRYASMHELLVELSRDPLARRRRIALAASAAAFVGAIGFGAATMSAPAIAACTGADQEIAAVWGDAKRASVQAAILGTGVAYAGDTWEKIAPRLDAYAGDWAAMRTEACESHRDQRHSDRLFDLRTACLDQRRAGLEGLIEALGSADAGVVENAVKAVASLPPLQTCADTEALTSAVPPPEDPEVAKKVQAVREGLARARSLEDTGRYAAGLELVDDILRHAPRLEYAPLLAEAQLRQGSLHMESGHAAEAAASLDSALWTAVGAGHDEVALEALSKRIFTQAALVGDARRALDDVPFGEALLQRVGDGPAVRGLFLNNVAVAHEAHGDYEAAERALESALELLTRARGESDPAVADARSNLGTLYLRTEHFAAAARVLAPTHDAYKAIFGDRSARAAISLLNLGLAHQGLGDLPRARDEIDAASATIRESFPDDSSIAAVALLVQGAVRSDMRDPSAIEYLERALARAEALPDLGDDRVVEVLACLGVSMSHAGDSAEALRVLRRAQEQLAVGRDNNNPHTEAFALDALGLALRHAGDLDGALRAHQDGLRVRRNNPSPARASLAISLEHVGAVLTELGRHDEAAAALDEAARVTAEALPPGSQQQATILRSQSALALARGDADAATARAREALVIHEASRDPGDGELALTRLALARALRAAGQADEALALARAAREALAAAGPGWRREADEAARFIAAAG